MKEIKPKQKETVPKQERNKKVENNLAEEEANSAKLMKKKRKNYS